MSAVMAVLQCEVQSTQLMNCFIVAVCLLRNSICECVCVHACVSVKLCVCRCVCNIKASVG